MPILGLGLEPSALRHDAVTIESFSPFMVELVHIPLHCYSKPRCLRRSELRAIKDGQGIFGLHRLADIDGYLLHPTLHARPHVTHAGGGECHRTGEP